MENFQKAKLCKFCQQTLAKSLILSTKALLENIFPKIGKVLLQKFKSISFMP